MCSTNKVFEYTNLLQTLYKTSGCNPIKVYNGTIIIYCVCTDIAGVFYFAIHHWRKKKNSTRA